MNPLPVPTHDRPGPSVGNPLASPAPIRVSEATGNTRVFVSFDHEHEEHLYEVLLQQSRLEASGFEVCGSSEPLTDTSLWSGRVRQQIAEADQVIVICGERTESSASVCAELRIAGEERTPYFLLWGQRGVMCTKPIGAKSAEGMYSWTPEILQERLAYLHRRDTLAGTASGESPKGSSRPA
jgi:hypothetical protein